MKQQCSNNLLRKAISLLAAVLFSSINFLNANPAQAVHVSFEEKAASTEKAIIIPGNDHLSSLEFGFFAEETEVEESELDPENEDWSSQLTTEISSFFARATRCCKGSKSYEAGLLGNTLFARLYLSLRVLRL